MIAALITSLAFTAALLVALVWQMKRAAGAMDKLLDATLAQADQRILLAANEVALHDKERALNMVTGERDRLEFTVDTITEQRDELLKESLERATPGDIAISVRDALKRLRDFPPIVSEAEDVPDVSSS